MQWYLSQVEQLKSSFKVFSIKQVPKNKNAQADSLATLATSLGKGLPKVIIVEDLVAPSWNGQVPIKINKINVGPSWMDEVVSFLRMGYFPKTKLRLKRSKERTPILALRKVEVIQAVVFRPIFIMCPS